MKVVIVGSGAQGTGLAGLLILGKDVEQQFIPGGSLANMGNFIVKNQDFIGQHADQIADQLLVVLAGRLAGDQQPLDV